MIVKYVPYVNTPTNNQTIKHLADCYSFIINIINAKGEKYQKIDLIGDDIEKMFQ